MIIVTLCDDDRPDERKCVVHYSIPTNFKTWGFNFNNALEMRFQILFQQTADRQQTDSRPHSADRGPKKSIIVVLSLHVQCCTY